MVEETFVGFSGLFPYITPQTPQEVPHGNVFYLRPSFRGAWLVVVISIVRLNLFICQPNEVIIFSGRKRQTADGRAWAIA